MKSLTVFQLSYRCMVFGAVMTIICLILAVVFINLSMLILTFIGLFITALALIVFLISGYQHTKGMDDRDR